MLPGPGVFQPEPGAILQRQSPFTQRPPSQERPHPPQFAASLRVFTQALPPSALQLSKPPGQAH